MVACRLPKEMEMMATRLHLLASIASVAAACAMTAPAFAAGAASEAAHEHAAAMPSKLSLDHGRRWATDETLRTGMGRIRGLVEPQLAKAHAGKLTTAEYKAVAGQVETEIGGIVANCKLEPKADAMLHLVIGDIGAGTDAMAGKNPKMKPQQGLVQVAAAVNNYGRYFEDPRFKPIPVGH
jgi:hypothetical protein